jgi:hypothetical protein
LKHVSHSPIPLLDLADRLGQRDGVLVAGAQEVKRQPLRSAPPTPGNFESSVISPLDGWRVQASESREVC